MDVTPLSLKVLREVLEDNGYITYFKNNSILDMVCLCVERVGGDFYREFTYEGDRFVLWGGTIAVCHEFALADPELMQKVLNHLGHDLGSVE